MLWPIGITAAAACFVWVMYRRDMNELSMAQGVLTLVAAGAGMIVSLIAWLVWALLQ